MKHYGDITKLNGWDLPIVDIITGGSPCQNLSIAGKRAGLAGEKFGVFHAYIEDIMGRLVYTHELAIQSISDEIKEKSRDDFIKLCKEEQEPCEDAIRREDAINAVSEALEHVVVENEDVARKMMNKLPSVIPQESCEDTMKSTEKERLIKSDISSMEYGSIQH